MTEAPYLSTTRTAYNTVAADYAEFVKNLMTEKPLDRAMLASFAELVLTDGGQVGDLGCGPGRVTAHLHSLGVNAFGIDLSPEMVAVARRMYPDLQFDEGRLTELDLKDASLAGAVAWYSIIHTPPALLPPVFAEFERVLAPGGHLLLAFQVGDNELRHIVQGYGHTVSLDAYRLSPEYITEQLKAAGFVMTAQLVRQPEAPETVPQAYLLARKPCL
jgi:SAM-dependent methyltransferase